MAGIYEVKRDGEIARKQPDVFANKMRAAANTDDTITVTTSWKKDGELKHPRIDDYIDFGHGKVLIQAVENQYEVETVLGITKKGETAITTCAG